MRAIFIIIALIIVWFLDFSKDLPPERPNPYVIRNADGSNRPFTDEDAYRLTHPEGN